MPKLDFCRHMWEGDVLCCLSLIWRSFVCHVDPLLEGKSRCPEYKAVLVTPGELAALDFVVPPSSEALWEDAES